MMKRQFEIIIVAAVFAITWAADCTQDDWLRYKKNFNKTYKSMQDELHHYDTFCDNFYIIEEHNAVYRRGEVNYTKSFNEFSDMTNEEVAMYLASRGIKRRRGSRRKVLQPESEENEDKHKVRRY